MSVLNVMVHLTDVFCASRKLEDEVEMVLQLWEEGGGLSRHQINSIQRVQNLPLWTKYAMTRAEIQASLPLCHNAGVWSEYPAHHEGKSCLQSKLS